jgi:hypothetical protein
LRGKEREREREREGKRERERGRGRDGERVAAKTTFISVLSSGINPVIALRAKKRMV